MAPDPLSTPNESTAPGGRATTGAPPTPEADGRRPGATTAPAPASDASTGRRSRAVRTAVGIVLAVVSLQALLFTLFAWPALHSAPRDLPVVVAGPPAATRPLATRLDRVQPGAFDVSVVSSPQRADRMLRNREAYAALVADPTGGLRMHVASAASEQIAGVFRQLAQGLSERTGHPVPVTDVVPADPDDPHGVVVSVGVLPLALTSMAAGILLGLLVRPRWVRLAGVLLFAALAGLGSVAIAHYGLSALPGSYAAAAAGVGCLALCVSGVLAGLTGLLGLRGAGIGALVVFVLGVPLSGLTSSPDLLPTGWGELGQFLPPGAGATLVRSVAFFDSAGIDRPLAVLAGWTLLGLVLIAVGRRPVGRTGGSAVPPADRRGARQRA